MKRKLMLTKERSECYLKHRLNNERITQLEDRSEENVQNAAQSNKVRLGDIEGECLI